MNCRICNVGLVEGAVFCGGCGSSITVDPESWRHAASRDSRLSDTTVMSPRRAVSSGHSIRDRQARVESVSLAGGPPSSYPDGISGEASNSVPGDEQRASGDGGRAADVDQQLVPGLTVDAQSQTLKKPWWRRRAAFHDNPGECESSRDSRPVQLRFSTGEHAIVTGSALIGRRPLAQSGETIEHFIAIVDPQRTVSKTHLEVGQYEGDLWVCDRFSVNGTVVTDAEGIIRSLEPGRRYLVRRGSTVVLGEQSFTID